ncbi:MAG: hypothetical protein ACRDY2_01565 [Acidimicrobiales bacterium]
MTTRRPATTEACTRRPPTPDEPAPTGWLLTVRCQVRLVGGESGRTLADAQGRALAAVLATLGEVEVGQGEEDRSP